eukprot:jgi/Botrbrau1/1813/Bobra.146_1s0011.1
MSGTLQAPASSSVLQAINQLVQAIPDMASQEDKTKTNLFTTELQAKRHRLRKAEVNILESHENAILNNQELDTLADKEFTEDWRKAGLPLRRTAVVLDGDCMHQGAIDPSQLVGAAENLADPLYVQGTLSQEGQPDLPQISSPHHLSATAVHRARAAAVAKRFGSRPLEAQRKGDFGKQEAGKLPRRSSTSPTKNHYAGNGSIEAAERRASNDRVLQRMHRKLAYLRGPRYVPSFHPSALDPSATDVAPSHKACFQSLPKQVHFSKFEVGRESRIHLRLRNNDNICRRFRIRPFRNCTFGILSIEHPQCQGEIAAGLMSRLLITFTPTSLADVQEELVVEVEGGGVLSVPVTAALPEPVLSLPSCTDMGTVLLGTRKELKITVRNTGGHADLVMVPNSTATFQHKEKFSSLENEEDVELGDGFAVAPSRMSLRFGEESVLCLTFAPEREVLSCIPLQILWQSGKTLTFQVQGKGEKLHGKLTLMEAQEHVKDGQQLWFGQCMAGSESVRCLRLERISSLNVPFEWRLRGGSEQCEGDDQSFLVDEARGTIRGGEAMNFRIVFRPKFCGRQTGTAELRVGLESPGVAACGEASFILARLALEGDALMPALTMVPKVLTLTEALQVGEAKVFPLLLVNPCEGPVEYTWDRSDPEVRVRPASGTIGPGEVLDSTVTIVPADAGPLQAQATCHVSHGSDLLLAVTGSAQRAAPLLSPDALDFGTLALGSSYPAMQLAIRNACPVTPLPWFVLPLTGCQNLHIHPSRGTLPPGQSQSVQVLLPTDAEGPVRGTLLVATEPAFPQSGNPC